VKPNPAAKPEPSALKPSANRDAAALTLSRRHLRLGWWSLLIFLTLGIVLETLHAFKLGWYLNVSNETRRLMWTLAHAHGALLGVIQIAFGLTVRWLPLWTDRRRTFAGCCLTGANLLLPGGFFLGGIFVHGGDPGLGILLVPLGGLLLFVGVFLTAQALGSRSS
jgi:hypothetical protein